MSECDPSCQRCNPRDETCAKCSTVIPRAVDHRNLDGGMLLAFHGWYGATIDPFHDVNVYLCAGCSETFLRDNDWLGKFDRELTSPLAPIK